MAVRFWPGMTSLEVTCSACTAEILCLECGTHCLQDTLQRAIMKEGFLSAAAAAAEGGSRVEEPALGAGSA
jgi:hypothetical protein